MVHRALGTGLVPLILAVRLAAQATGQSPQDSSFLLSTTDPSRVPSPFIANGHLGVVIPALGIGASSSFLAGLYDHAGDDVPRIVAIPAWNAIGVSDGTHGLDSTAVSAAAIDDYRQVLDMRRGTVLTSYVWNNSVGKVAVRTRTFVSRADPGLSVVQLELTPQYASRLGVRFAILGRRPPKRLPLARLDKADPAWKPGDIWYPGHMMVRSRQVTRTSQGARLATAAQPEGRSTTLAQAAEITWPRSLKNPSARTVTSGDTAMVELTFDTEPGATYAFFQVSSALVSSSEKPLVARAGELARAGTARGFKALEEANARAWHRRWESDIEVEGDPELQRVVRSMLFYLLCSADSGTNLGIPPMGLSSAGYYGHIFWDSDTWMFPPLLALHPDLAHSLVAFRTRTLPSARANAEANGFRGAMYPWEADELGEETTPYFAIQNARSEIHVNGDVALAQWQYFLATADSSWLRREGYPVIQETADFWVSRSAYDSADGRFHIRNVVSVSEGLIGVSDDAYTNAVARLNLEIATRASRQLQTKPNPRWMEVAAKLHLPYDSTSEFYRTYAGAPDSTLGDVTPLLAYPLGLPMSERAKRTQLEQAVRRLLTEGPGAMMGSTLLSVDAAELGDRAMIDSLLPHSYRGWLQGPFLMLSETPEKKDAVNFVTGAGGFLQQVIYGYTGLRWKEKGLEPAFPPILPGRIKRVTLRNVYSRGRRYDVVIDSAGRRITPHKAR